MEWLPPVAAVRCVEGTGSLGVAGGAGHFMVLHNTLLFCHDCPARVGTSAPLGVVHAPYPELSQRGEQPASRAQNPGDLQDGAPER